MNPSIFYFFAAILSAAVLNSALAVETNHVDKDDWWKELNKTLEIFFSDENKPQDEYENRKAEPLFETKKTYGYDAFNCMTLKSPQKPTSAHALMPGDINVVAAMGDSITAASGALALTALGVLVQYRGVSWSMGGDKSLNEVTTLPNILRQYNPNIYGFSVKTARTGTKNARLNFAKPAARSRAMKGQAELLIEEMKKDPKVDFENDWKVITIFIGGNDLCVWCRDKEYNSPARHLSYMRESIDILHANVPRAFVNLVTSINVTMMNEVSQGITCGLLNLIECKCAVYPKNNKALRDLSDVVSEYIKVIEDLVASSRYDTREDFTVVTQPFLTKTQPPRKMEGGQLVPDMSYFAPDCFHFSGKAHAAAAVALWNNMVEPVGGKRLMWTVGEPLECPTQEHPYFYTSKNSK